MSGPGAETAPQRQISVLLSVLFLAVLAQMTLSPIVAPLARQVGLAEWQAGATISVSAAMVVLASQPWGRLSQSRGRKPVLVASLGLALVVMTLFSLTSWAGMAGLVSGVALFVLFLLLRGLGFGTAIAAWAPTAQAYIADVTHDEAARVRGMARVGAVQGAAIIAGSLLGGALAWFGLMVPIVAVPVLLALALTLALFRLRPEPSRVLVAAPARVRPTDPRVWPFLVTGFGMFTALGCVQTVAGFLVQDRFGLDAETTGLLTGGVLLAAGIGSFLAQAAIVPRSGWSPPALLRIGSVTALVGLLAVIPDAAVAVAVVGTFLVGVGIGIAIPGYTAGPSLFMSREEQGGLAGLIGATNGSTYIVAPTLATLLYGRAPVLPIAVAALALGLVAVFVTVHPRFRGWSAAAADH